MTASETKIHHRCPTFIIFQVSHSPLSSLLLSYLLFSSFSVFTIVKFNLIDFYFMCNHAIKSNRVFLLLDDRMQIAPLLLLTRQSKPHTQIHTDTHTLTFPYTLMSISEFQYLYLTVFALTPFPDLKIK